MTITKYSGNGNDFIMFIAGEKKDRSALAQTLCHRQNGVGADGLVVLIPHKKYDFEWEFYNADGSHADMCGNASRCVAHFAHEKGISKDSHAEFLTSAGVIRATINGLYVVSDMTEPDIIRTDIEETSHAVNVVPILAPMMTVIACLSPRRPALTKPTTITVVALDDWTKRVTIHEEMKLFDTTSVSFIL